MADTQIRQVPVEFSLELMAVVSTHGINTKGKPGDNIVNKIDRALLIVFSVDLECPYTGGVINSRKLKKPNQATIFRPQLQEFDIHLDMMSGDLLLIAMSQYSSFPGIPGKPVHSISLEDVIYSAGRYDYSVITLQEPCNTLGS